MVVFGESLHIRYYLLSTCVIHARMINSYRPPINAYIDSLYYIIIYGISGVCTHHITGEYSPKAIHI